MMSKLSWVVRCACGVAFVLIVLVPATGCGSRAPRPCPTCGGTGKVQHSEQALAPYEVTEAKLINNGFFNPDYTAKVTIYNKSDADGTFGVTVNFVYDGIGQHTETGDVFVRSHSSSTCSIRYDADKSCNRWSYDVVAPSYVKTEQSVCPACGGNGLK